MADMTTGADPAGVTANASLWQSEAKVKDWVANMDERERKRADQFRFMTLLLPYPEDAAFTVLDLGAGTGVAARAVLTRFPNARAILADFSDQMMGQGERVMAPYAGRYQYVTYDMNTSAWPAAIPSHLAAVVTSQCVHHLSDERKQGLFREILAHLRPGGWYVNFDPIQAADPAVAAVWERINDTLDPKAAHQRTHRTSAQEESHAAHVRYMIDLDTQLGYLRAAGFAAVDTYWKHLDYVIYGGSKPG
jgi:tRNA (cmo5U34)-methyltransferase